MTMGEHTNAKTAGAGFLLGVIDRLRQETYGDSRPWWETPTAEVIVDLAKAGPFVSALAGIAAVLMEGEEPMWVVGGTTASAAFAVAQEWLDAGVEPSEVGGWLRAGCWDSKAARQMVEVGLRPGRLLDENGKPAHWIEASSGENMPVALAVADSFLTPEQAVRVVVGR